MQDPNANTSTITRDAADETASDEVRFFLQNLFQEVLKKRPLKESYGITDQTMQSMYAHAYRFYSQGDLQGAETLFRFLTTFDNFHPDYALGLAAVYQQKGEFQKAVEYYQISFYLSGENYLAKFYAGQCFLRLNNKKEAKASFEAVVQGSIAQEFKDKAQAYLSAL